MRFTPLFAAALFPILLLPMVSMAQSSEPDINSYIESLRADLRADKVTIITDAMQFNAQESKIFWPIYRRYEADVVKFNDDRLALIKSYSDKFATMTDSEAKAMTDRALELESRRIALKKKYTEEFQRSGLSALTVAKFTQLEHRLDLLMDIQIASHLPSLLNKRSGQSSPTE